MKQEDYNAQKNHVYDLLSTGRGPHHASTWAWENRWEHLPTEFSGIKQLAQGLALNDDSLLQLTLAAARRIHYAFAFETLTRFCRAALEQFPDEELLLVLDAAAGTALGHVSWQELELRVQRYPCEGIAAHVFQTAVYISADAPRDVLERALVLARSLAENKDIIAMYRIVSLLRRLGRGEESLKAGMLVNEEIIVGRHSAKLSDHLAERVLVERHLVIAGLSAAQFPSPRSDGPAIGAY